jgi:hypothetical protein
MRRRGCCTPWRAAVSKIFAGTDLDALTFHELRHTAAALAKMRGVVFGASFDGSCDCCGVRDWGLWGGGGRGVR